MRIFRTYTIHAARSIPTLKDDHICKNLHGHTFKIAIEIDGDINEVGFVMDFYYLDIIVKDVPRIQIEDNIKISDVLLEMTKFKMGLCAFLQDQTIFGIISDGDIRRLLVKNSEKKFITKNDINCDYIFESDLDKYDSEPGGLKYRFASTFLHKL